MDKYMRQMALEQIGLKGQALLRKSRVAIIGVGATGCCTAELLARAGVGKILLVDHDVVTLVNLHRQMLFGEKDVGKKKVDVAKRALRNINSDVDIITEDLFLDEKNAEILDDCGLVLDCTDNMKARNVINDYCKRKKRLWVYSAATGVIGNVLVVSDYKKFRRVFGSAESFDNCESIGVMNAVPVLISAVQTTEAIKVLMKKKHCRDMIRIDAWNNTYEKLRF